MTRATCAVVIVAVCARSLAAQTLARPETQARATADSFYTAIAEGRWSAAAAIIDMKRFNRFFGQERANARSMAMPQPKMTAEQLMRSDTTMPRAVAEWQVARMNERSSERLPVFAYQFADVKTLDALLALTPEQAAAKWLEAQDERYGLRLAWEMSGCRNPMPPYLRTQPNKNAIRAVALGDDSTAFVVYIGGSTYLGALTATGDLEAQLMLMHRIAGAWRVDPEYLQHRGGRGGLGFSAECNSVADSARSAAEARDVMLGTLMSLRTAEEVFFVDSARYTDKLQRLRSLYVSQDVTVQPIVLAPAAQGPGYQITVISKRAPGVKCGMSVGKIRNPVDSTAAEGEPKCVKLLSGQRDRLWRE